MRGALTALLIGLTPLPALAETVLWRDGPARVSLRDGRVVAETDGDARAVEARPPGAPARAATPLGAVAVEGGRLVLLTAEADGGARRLVGFLLNARGRWTSVGSVPVGTGAPALEPRLLVPDPAFPEPAPRVPVRVLAGRLAADAEGLPGTVAEALGPARCPGAGAPTLEGAASAARALPPLDAEAAALGLAACLVVAARPFEARRALGLVLGRERAARLPALEAELAARVACSPHLQAIRRASPPEKNFLQGRCGQNSL